MTNISADELKAWLDDPARPQPILIDVREAWEWEICRLESSHHVPLRTVPARINDIDASAEIVVICHHGGRSAQAGRFLEQQGFNRVFNLAGGIHGWSQRIDPSLPIY